MGESAALTPLRRPPSRCPSTFPRLHCHQLARFGPAHPRFLQRVRQRSLSFRQRRIRTARLTSALAPARRRDSLTVLTSLTTSVRLASTALNTIYLQSTSPSRLSLPLSVRGPILDSLSRCADVGLGLLAPQGEVLSGLYASEWKVYVQEKLVEHVVKELGAWSAQAGGRRGGGEGVKGMADCYCL